MTRPRRWLPLLVLLMAGLAAAYAAGVWTSRGQLRLTERQRDEARQALAAAGWQEVETVHVEVLRESVPVPTPYAVPVLSVEGGTEPRPVDPMVITERVEVPADCPQVTMEPEDIGCWCRLNILDLDGEQWGQLVTWSLAHVHVGDQILEVRRGTAEQPIPADRVRLQRATPPRPLPWRLDLALGATTEPAALARAGWYRRGRRWGAWGQAAYDLDRGTWEPAAGVSWRLGPR